MHTHIHTQVWGGTSFIPSLHPDLCLCADFTRDLGSFWAHWEDKWQSALRGQILSFLNLSTLGKKWDGTVLHWQAPPPVCSGHHRSHGQSFRKAAHLAQQGQGGFSPMKSHRSRLLPLWRKGSCATRPPCHYFILGLENFSWLPHCLPRA